MDDRYDEVLEKYDFSVSKMSRARGAMVLWTDKGIKLLCETHASAGRLVWENKVKNHLKENGFERIDTFVINMEQVQVPAKAQVQVPAKEQMQALAKEQVQVPAKEQMKVAVKEQMQALLRVPLPLRKTHWQYL